MAFPVCGEPVEWSQVSRTCVPRFPQPSTVASGHPSALPKASAQSRRSPGINPPLAGLREEDVDRMARMLPQGLGLGRSDGIEEDLDVVTVLDETERAREAVGHRSHVVAARIRPDRVWRHAPEWDRYAACITRQRRPSERRYCQGRQTIEIPVSDPIAGGFGDVTRLPLVNVRFYGSSVRCPT